MDVHEDPEPDKAEKATRFGCGALLGVFLGLYVAIHYAFQSFGPVVAIVIIAALVCGVFALKYGDDFWHAIIRSWEDN